MYAAGSNSVLSFKSWNFVLLILTARHSLDFKGGLYFSSRTQTHVCCCVSAVEVLHGSVSWDIVFAV